MGNEMERLAALEAEVKSLAMMLAKVDAKLDAWHSNYVPRVEINEMLRSRDEKIAALTAETTTKRNLAPIWASVAISVISLITALYGRVTLH